MKVQAYKPHDVFCNIVECGHCGIKYDVEFYYKRYQEAREMNVVCPLGHVQTIILRPVYESSGMARLLDRIDFQKVIKCDS